MSKVAVCLSLPERNHRLLEIKSKVAVGRGPLERYHRLLEIPHETFGTWTHRADATRNVGVELKSSKCLFLTLRCQTWDTRADRENWQYITRVAKRSASLNPRRAK